ncbi:MAG: hypothetical protein ACJ74Q_15800 [Pyrinomonadaceae bacterium]
MRNEKTNAAPAAGGSWAHGALINAGRLISAMKAPALCLLMVALSAAPTFAQTGPIFNGNASKLGAIIRAILLLAAALVTVLGVGFAIKGIKNYGSDEKWSSQAVATILCFGLSTFLAVMWAISQGTPVDVGLDF